MQLSLIPLLACPDCQGEIELLQSDKPDASTVITGLLGCQNCRRTFAVTQRIPQMLPLTLLAEQAKEMEARDDQVEQYDNNFFLTLFGLLEIPLTRHLLQTAPEDRLLEAGCGTGRMTTTLAKSVKELVAVDFSFQSLVENEMKIETALLTNVHLIQADLCHLPLKARIFDRAVSCQVLEHVPTPETRAQAVANIARTLRRNAAAVISAYQESRWTKEKQGEHDGGIPFFRFTEDEFIELLSAAFDVEEVVDRLIYIFLARCRVRHAASVE